jgi:PKD repeat protein
MKYQVSNRLRFRQALLFRFFLIILVFANTPALAVHLDVEIWGDGDRMQAGFCRTPGAVGCDLTQLIASLNLPANTLPVDGASGKMIFLSDFRDFSGGPNKTPNPGFQSVEQALDANELISYEAMGVLEYWNSKSLAWEPAPATVRIRLAGAIDPAFIITDFNQCGGQLFCFAPGYDPKNSFTLFSGSGISGLSQMVIDATNNQGSLHTHLNFFLENQQGVLGGPVSAYLLELRVFSKKRLQASDSILVMFNAGLSTEQFSKALMARIDSLPPPPLVYPVANAGVDQSATTDSLVALNGTGSHDPQPGPSALSYLWQQTSGPNVKLSAANSISPSFTPTQTGIYSFRLEVNDGELSAFDTVTINVTEPPPVILPVADAGIDLSAETKTSVTLDGSASLDPEPGPAALSFNWLQIQGPPVELNLANTAKPQFNPDRAGVYVFSLSVSDGVRSVQDSVTVTVTDPPPVIPPIANAGTDQSVNLHASVLLDASASQDPEPGPALLSYRWTQTSGLSVQLQHADSVKAGFSANQAGQYEFKLEVYDGKSSAFDWVQVVVKEPSPVIYPVANAGLDQMGEVNQAILLDGSFSHDPASGPGNLTFNWLQIFGNTITLTASDTANPSFTPTEAGIYTFRLEVSDGANSVSDTVTVSIKNPPPVIFPVAQAGADQTVFTLQRVTLDGSASHDPEPGPSALTYRWLQTAGVPIQLTGADTASAGFTPDQAGLYQFRLEVSDGINTAIDSVNIHVSMPPPVILPVADAGPDQVVSLNKPVKLDGGTSHDPEPGPAGLSYVWLQTAGVPVELSDSATSLPVFTPVLPGKYSFNLTVSDGKQQANDEVIVIVPVLPEVNAGADRLVRINSEMLLDASGSRDPDPGPNPLSYHWQQSLGYPVDLKNNTSSSPKFSPKQPGSYGFKLAISDGINEVYDEVTFTVPKLGDVDLDGDVDRIDVALILRASKKQARIADGNDIRDLDGNRRINKVDAIKAKNLCTLRLCRPTRR